VAKRGDKWEQWYEMLHKAKPNSKEWYEIASMMENHHVRASIFNREPYDEKELFEVAEKAVTSAQHALGENHPRAAEALQNVGFFYAAIKDDADKARGYFEKASALAGDSNPVLALTYYSLGVDYFKKKDVDRAQELLREALDIQRADATVDRTDLSNTLYMLSYTTANTIGRDAALPLAKEAYDVLKANSPKSAKLSDIKDWITKLGKR
jgi:tetratricopeptide (TPR) repeat protein